MFISRLRDDGHVECVYYEAKYKPKKGNTAWVSSYAGVRPDRTRNFELYKSGTKQA